VFFSHSAIDRMAPITTVISQRFSVVLDESNTKKFGGGASKVANVDKWIDAQTICVALLA